MKHLIDAHGADKFAQLLATFKDGSTPDDAFQKVYGFGQLGLETNGANRSGFAARRCGDAIESTDDILLRGERDGAVHSTGDDRQHLGVRRRHCSADDIGIIAALGLMVVGAGSGAYLHPAAPDVAPGGSEGGDEQPAALATNVPSLQ